MTKPFFLAMLSAVRYVSSMIPRSSMQCIMGVFCQNKWYEFIKNNFNYLLLFKGLFVRDPGGGGGAPSPLLCSANSIHSIVMKLIWCAKDRNLFSLMIIMYQSWRPITLFKSMTSHLKWPPSWITKKLHVQKRKDMELKNWFEKLKKWNNAELKRSL